VVGKPRSDTQRANSEEDIVRTYGPTSSTGWRTGDTGRGRLTRATWRKPGLAGRFCRVLRPARPKTCLPAKYPGRGAKSGQIDRIVPRPKLHGPGSAYAVWRRISRCAGRVARVGARNPGLAAFGAARRVLVAFAQRAIPVRFARTCLWRLIIDGYCLYRKRALRRT
jgi:hypothetical protein